jgi:hypothetical protein
MALLPVRSIDGACAGSQTLPSADLPQRKAASVLFGRICHLDQSDSPREYNPRNSERETASLGALWEQSPLTRLRLFLGRRGGSFEGVCCRIRNSRAKSQRRFATRSGIRSPLTGYYY